MIDNPAAFSSEAVPSLPEPAEDVPPSPGIPMPPLEMRALVGPTDESAFHNPSGGLLYPYIPASAYARVFDFGCGCGRVARQLIQQDERPARYMGIDLHLGMVTWCKRNLEPLAPGFVFEHHDVFNAGFNPGRRKPAVLPFPAEDHSFSLVNAWSVFTHLVQPSAEFYVGEVARILEPDGYFHMTVFLFDKAPFPMMQSEQNAMYINADDPTNAVIFDREWFLAQMDSVGLTLTMAMPPAIRGFHWCLVFRPKQAGVDPIALPDDAAPFGIARPPVSTRPPREIH